MRVHSLLCSVAMEQKLPASADGPVAAATTPVRDYSADGQTHCGAHFRRASTHRQHCYSSSASNSQRTGQELAASSSAACWLARTRKIRQTDRQIALLCFVRSGVSGNSADSAVKAAEVRPSQDINSGGGGDDQPSL